MLVKEIKPIGKIGKDLLKENNAYEIIDKIIELPLRKACKIFKEKNIETTMSSANRKNILKKGKSRIEKEDIKCSDGKVHIFSPTFLEAGKGYAWIMINYDQLSNSNKEKIFELEKRFGEKRIWIVYSSYFHCFNKPEEYSDFKKRFDEKSIQLVYNNKYPRRSVFLRMPIDENTTIDEVEEYFSEIADEFDNQNN